MKIKITNLSPADVYLGDMYLTVPVGTFREVDRGPADLSAMPTLQKAVVEGTVAIEVTYTAQELASGLLSPPDATQAQDMAPVAAANVASPLVLLRKELVAGGGGAADDVSVFALGALPFKARVVDAWAFISGGSGVGRSVQLRTQAAGAGALAAQLPATANGRSGMDASITASALLTPGASVGLFARRSDSAIAGEVFLLLRRES